MILLNSDYYIYFKGIELTTFKGIILKAVLLPVWKEASFLKRVIAHFQKRFGIEENKHEI